MNGSNIQKIKKTLENNRISGRVLKCGGRKAEKNLNNFI
jgi:hypothetical protein